MVLLFNLTASYAQTGKVFIIDGDTLIGYNKSELEKIAIKMVRSHECDTLLSITEQQLVKKNVALQAKDSALVAKDSIISQKDYMLGFKEEIIAGKNDELDRTRKGIKKLSRKLRWSKTGMYASALGLFVSIVLLLTK